MSRVAVDPRPLTPSLTANIVTLIVASALLAVSAKVEIPFWPVPMTLEVLAVLGLAGLFGARIAAGAVLLWLFEGALGLPVFAGPAAGVAYLGGPTGGYLVGFFLAAALVGFAAERGLRTKPVLLFLVMLVGVGIVYATGVTWLAHLVGWSRAFHVGMLPFIPADLTKAALASALVFGAARLVPRA